MERAGGFGIFLPPFSYLNSSHRHIGRLGNSGESHLNLVLWGFALHFSLNDVFIAKTSNCR